MTGPTGLQYSSHDGLRSGNGHLSNSHCSDFFRIFNATSCHLTALLTSATFHSYGDTTSHSLDGRSEPPRY